VPAHGLYQGFVGVYLTRLTQQPQHEFDVDEKHFHLVFPNFQQLGRINCLGAVTVLFGQIRWIICMDSPATQPIGLPFMCRHPPAGFCFVERQFDAGEIIVELGVEVCKTFLSIPLAGRRVPEQRLAGLVSEICSHLFQQVVQVRFQSVEQFGLRHLFLCMKRKCDTVRGGTRMTRIRRGFFSL